MGMRLISVLVPGAFGWVLMVKYQVPITITWVGIITVFVTGVLRGQLNARGLSLMDVLVAAINDLRGVK